MQRIAARGCHACLVFVGARQGGHGPPRLPGLINALRLVSTHTRARTGTQRFFIGSLRLGSSRRLMHVSYVCEVCDVCGSPYLYFTADEAARRPQRSLVYAVLLTLLSILPYSYYDR